MIILKELTEQAQELIDCGNSKQKAEGQGMMTVINTLSKYVLGYYEYDAYYDSLSEEAQRDIDIVFRELGIY